MLTRVFGPVDPGLRSPGRVASASQTFGLALGRGSPPLVPACFFFLRPVIANAFSPVALTQEIKAPAHVIPRRYAALPLTSKDTKPRAI